MATLGAQRQFLISPPDHGLAQISTDPIAPHIRLASSKYLSPSARPTVTPL
ncbi:hypothetical protein CONPUDRAFT_156144 [Coniophora puteana RWD-64-598 SS2]|uniref:Uncharacterized protein n=1 Tax=Coniophora puteana (strain RWD-64-598) TaxID=741705 RepID=A0A5M3MHL8_CONPW|nr:uncharacterized protein CONPUDRAFT_156144 [Coniophora puteana RWD-64-598 SS2]EIW78135.1 hypothetical protein CONPUDRAFT_156144 [Coniophora puteana RWD-64-598 SS2]